MFLKGYLAACALSESNASVGAWDKILWVLVAFSFHQISYLKASHSCPLELF